MTKELQTDKKAASNTPDRLVGKVKEKLADIEVCANIHMAPKKEYPIKVKISKIEKAKPRIDPRELIQYCQNNKLGKFRTENLKKSSKCLSIIAVLGLLLLVLSSGSLNYSTMLIEGEEINEEGRDNPLTPVSSGNWVINELYINRWNEAGTNGTFEALLDKPWCSGTGSWDDPFIIENLTIDASKSSTGSGIIIQDYNGIGIYFIIRNCKIYNAGSSGHGAGILLLDTNNGTLLNNNCSNNYGPGIKVGLNTENNTIQGNILNSNANSSLILIGYNKEIKIIGNTMNNNKGQGIEFLS